MAFKTPRTWTDLADGDTHVLFQDEIYSQLNELWKGQAAGDMDYYAAADAKARLAIGGAGRVLFSNGSVPGWAGCLLAYGTMSNNWLSLPATKTLNVYGAGHPSTGEPFGFIPVGGDTKMTVPAGLGGLYVIIVNAFTSQLINANLGAGDYTNFTAFEGAVKLNGTSILDATIEGATDSGLGFSFLTVKSLAAGDQVAVDVTISGTLGGIGVEDVIGTIGLLKVG